VGIVPQEKAKVGPLMDCLASYQPTTENGQTVPPLRSRNTPPGWELTDEAARWRQFTMDQLEDRLRREGLLDTSVPPGIVSAGSDDAKTKTETPAPPVFDDVQSVQNDEAFFADDPDPFQNHNEFEQGINKEPLAARVYLGEELISAHYPNQKTGKLQKVMLVRPGEDVTITTVKSGKPEPVSFQATICDVFRSGMTEYDSKLVLVNLEQLQQNRGMLTRDENGEIAVDHITSIQIKLKDYDHAEVVVDKLKAAFDPAEVTVRTWESTQGVLLSAVEMETAILNVLLFLIITVAGFGILAIFYMIVVEKTRDIGILKSLGASSRGVMSIFLSYGLALGLVGSAAGVTIGLVFVKYINQIEDALSWVTGREVFNRDIYYFSSIPTHVNPMMVFWVALGAMGIAVLASILPARRASRLHPVRALRFD
jgi:lipoprotein-releasing system permease protein